MGYRVAFAIGTSLFTFACERPPAPQPTTDSATSTLSLTTTTQAVQKIPSTFIVTQADQPDREISFPPAKLVLKEIDGKTHASLFSIDPPEALRDDYTGNTFFLEMVFDTPIAELSGAEFVYMNSENARPEDDTGIFLAGRKQVLQPLNAAVRVDQLDDQWVVQLAGVFQLFESKTPDQVSLNVNLRARLIPDVVIKK